MKLIKLLKIKIMKKHKICIIGDGLSGLVTAQILSKLDIQIDLISKTPLIFSDHNIYDEINKSLDITLESMRLKEVNTLLVHNVSKFLEVNPRAYSQSLIKLKKEGKVRKIGISIYEVKEFEATTKFFIPDVVQLPISIIDQRFLKKKFLGAKKIS